MRWDWVGAQVQAIMQFRVPYTARLRTAFIYDQHHTWNTAHPTNKHVILSDGGGNHTHNMLMQQHTNTQPIDNPLTPGVNGCSPSGALPPGGSVGSVVCGFGKGPNPQDKCTPRIPCASEQASTPVVATLVLTQNVKLPIRIMYSHCLNECMLGNFAACIFP